MITIAPGATFEATATAASGLAGTIGARIRDNQGADYLARTTTSIAADVTVGSTTVYRRTFTAPPAAGQWTLIWDDGTTVVATEELLVTYTAPTPETGSVYITANELKGSLTVSGSYADDDFDAAVLAASRAIDDATGRFFYQDTTTRYYTPDRCDATLDIDDFTAISALTIDTNHNGSFATSWTEGTDYDLYPYNAAAVGWPYTAIRIRYGSGRVWPWYERTIKVQGTFGWPAVPAAVKEYAGILAAQLLMRSRQAPFGILMAGMEVGTSARLARVDPDFQRLVGRYVKTRPIR